jgi:1-acyl-sn-glycerol-3-phosphate acyltransferase
MVVLYRAKTITKILVYLFVQMIWFNLIRLFKSRPYQDSWLNYNVVRWGHLVIKEINLNCTTINDEVLKSIDWKRNVFLVANHQSYVDIPAIYVASQKMFGFIAGALKIAWQLDAILIPIVLQGTREAWEERKKISQEHVARATFGKPIDLREINASLSFKEFLKTFRSHFSILHDNPGANQHLPFSTKQAAV